MLNCCTATSRPRSRAGEISAMYIGETTEAPPIPSPPTKRKNSSAVPVPGQGTADGGNEVQHGDHRQHGTAAEGVGRAAGRHRADDRADQGRGHGESQPEIGQVEDLLQGVGGARDDDRIEAEQQAAQGGHQRAAEEITVDFHDPPGERLFRLRPDCS